MGGEIIMETSGLTKRWKCLSVLFFVSFSFCVPLSLMPSFVSLSLRRIGETRSWPSSCQLDVWTLVYHSYESFPLLCLTSAFFFFSVPCFFFFHPEAHFLFVLPIKVLFWTELKKNIDSLHLRFSTFSPFVKSDKAELLLQNWSFCIFFSCCTAPAVLVLLWTSVPCSSLLTDRKSVV